MVQFFCFLLSFFYVQRPGGRGLGGRVQSGDDLSVACGDSSPGRGAFSFRCGGATSQALRASSPSQGEPRGVRRSQCLPLLRGGAERSEAERFRRAAAAGRPLRRCAPAPLRKGSQGRGLCRGGVVRSKRYCRVYSSILGCQAQEVLLEFNILLISHGIWAMVYEPL